MGGIISITRCIICIHLGFLFERNFVFCTCICQGLFATTCLSCNCYSVLVCQRCRSLTYVYRELKTTYVNTLFWRIGVGGGSAIYYWLFFQYMSVDTISIFFPLLSIDSTKGARLRWLLIINNPKSYGEVTTKAYYISR